MACYMLLTEDGCDQIVATEADAKKEKRDLINLGCGKVRIRRFDTWAEAEAYEDKLRGY